MKSAKTVAILCAIVGVSIASAYYDQYGNYHKDIITEGLDTLTGGRYSDTPKEEEARKKAGEKLEDTQKSASRKLQDTREAARRKYQDTQREIQRKKEERRIKTDINQ